MMKFVRLAFVVTFLISFSFAAAFSKNGNASSRVETLMLNGHEKSGESYSLLSDDSSPGIQEGNDVGFVKEGPLNLTLGEMVFELCGDFCVRKAYEICYDANFPDGRRHYSCLPSQCSLKIYGEESFPFLFDNANWEQKGDGKGCGIFSLKRLASTCKPKIQNGMIQLKVIQYSCPVKAKDSRIKYPEIPSTTVRSSQQSGQNPDAASASLWYNSWWFILIAVCVIVALIFGGAAGLLFYCLKKKRNSIKAPPPPSTIAADKKTVTVGQQPSVVMPHADLKKKKKKNNGKAEKKAAAPPKPKTPPLSGKNPYGGDDTQDFLDLVKSKSYSSKSI